MDLVAVVSAPQCPNELWYALRTVNSTLPAALRRSVGLVRGLNADSPEAAGLTANPSVAIVVVSNGTQEAALSGRLQQLVSSRTSLLVYVKSEHSPTASSDGGRWLEALGVRFKAFGSTDEFVQLISRDWIRCVERFVDGARVPSSLKPFHDQDGIAPLWTPRRAGHGIFLSYRRTTSGFVARILHSDLERMLRLPVHVDFEDFYGGINLRHAIQHFIGSSLAVLVLIDAQWTVTACPTNPPSARQDWVCFELESALASGVPMIPVLIEDASPPLRHQLPDSLRELADLVGVRLTHEHWNVGVDRIAVSLRNYI